MLSEINAHIFVNAQLQSSILHHINAVIIISRPKQPLAFLQLNEHHVSTKLQEQWLLKVTQHPNTDNSFHSYKNFLNSFKLHVFWYSAPYMLQIYIQDFIVIFHEKVQSTNLTFLSM